MVLSQRDRNKMAGKADGKRKKVEIDLTGDSDDDSRQTKAPKRPSAPTYPTRSMPRSSHSGGYEYVYGPPSQLPTQGQHSQAERESWLADEDDVDDVVFFSTQAAAADTDLLHHYGNIHGKIVGVRFYNGHANSGEQVLMKREPGNPYDSNAIRVDNVQGNQIGHIPRQLASKLAKFMDNSFLHCEGELAGQIGQFDCPLSIRLFGPDPQTEEGVLLSNEMKTAKLPTDVLKALEKQRKDAEKARQKAEKDRKAEEKRQLALARRSSAQGGSGSNARIPSDSQRGFAASSQSVPGPSSQPVMQDLLEAAERFNPREIGNSTDQYGMQEDTLVRMPLATQPKAIKTEMLPYQLQALRWLLDQESPQLPPPGAQDTVQLWKRERNLFTNIATNYSVSDWPPLASGGILADDMGLGKTLEMISLLVADNEKAGRRTGTTLIVAPLSVMSNWSGQIAMHVHQNHALSIYTYHGAGRVKMNASDFSGYDVVITTYQTLATDYMPKAKGSNTKPPEKQLRPTGLYSLEWRRVILDEGHTIRNPQSKGAMAVTALISKSRWVLTGTPIVNSLRDLYSILKYIGITGGMQNLEIFNRVLVRPLKQNDPSATLLLKAIMSAFTLRRRKEMGFVDLRLPELEEWKQRIDFTEKERQRYDVFAAEAKGLLSKYEDKAQRAGTGAGQAFAHLLEILLRMRQCCNHWQLCGERVTNLLAQISEEKKTVDLTPENEKALQDMLQVCIESQDDCPICLETVHDPVITTCTHTYGRECIEKVLETQGKCPMCRAELKPEMLVSPKNDCGDDADADDDLDLTQSSTKLEGMMEILNASRGSGDKTIVFSQWTRFLDIVQSRLDREGFKYCRIDGTMPAGQRDASLQSLADDDDCTIMLASLGVCAVGLNLTAANQIILSDTWWAPAIEDQAVDRVHRLGQKKKTRVWRMIVNDTIEQQTLDIQADKRKLMQLAFSEKAGKRDKVKAGRLADIQRLLRGGRTAEANAAARNRTGNRADDTVEVD